MSVCLYVSVGMFVYLYVCMFVCLYACLYVCMFVSLYVCMFVSLYVCMFVLSHQIPHPRYTQQNEVGRYLQYNTVHNVLLLQTLEIRIRSTVYLQVVMLTVEEEPGVKMFIGSAVIQVGFVTEYMFTFCCYGYILLLKLLQLLL